MPCPSTSPHTFYLTPPITSSFSTSLSHSALPLLCPSFILSALTTPLSLSRYRLSLRRLGLCIGCVPRIRMETVMSLCSSPVHDGSSSYVAFIKRNNQSINQVALASVSDRTEYRADRTLKTHLMVVQWCPQSRPWSESSPRQGWSLLRRPFCVLVV